MPAPSLETMCWRPRESLARNPPRLRSVAHLVRSLRTCARIRSLTTGTFNQIFKDRITLRLSGANSVRRILCADSHSAVQSSQARLHRIHPSSKLFNHTGREKPCQLRHPTEFPLVFHNGNFCADRCRRGTTALGCPVELSSIARGIQARSSMVFRRPQILKWRYISHETRVMRLGACFFGRAKAEDRKLIKELAWRSLP